MSNVELRGVLFFSDQEPKISGYLVVDGKHFEIAGWKASRIRGEITAREINKASNDDARSAASGSECDSA